MNPNTSNHTTTVRRATTDFATLPSPHHNNSSNSSSSGIHHHNHNNNGSNNAKVHDINYILGPSADRPSTPRADLAEPPIPDALLLGAPAPRAHDTSTAASLLTNIPGHRQLDQDGHPIQYTPTTHRISKAKKGKKVHVCEFGCGKVFTRAEHRKRHEANHRSEPLYKCQVEGCNKPFQRLDLLNRHLERQHGIGPATADAVSTTKGNSGPMGPPPKRPHSSTASGKNDWNTHKATIERLYITENRPLKDIKVHMEEKYGFTPVEDRAYEKAFRRLGLSKNIPSSTMEAILRAVEDRTKKGKETLVYWRGQRIDEKRIHRFRQRLARENRNDKLDPNEFLSQGRSMTLPEHVRCVTPNNNNNTNNNIINSAEPLDSQSVDVPSPESSEGDSGEDSLSEDGEEGPRKQFSCTRCRKRFPSERRLNRHYEFPCSQPVQIKCPAPNCVEDQSLDFESHNDLWKHMVEKHMSKQ